MASRGLSLVVLAVAAGLAAAPGRAQPVREYAVSIDPADYLASVPDASRLATQLVAQFAANGVNTVYLNAYNVEYGAYYRTSYPYNSESDYGRQDLLGKLLAASHAHGIAVFAAFYDHQHRGAWEARPGWREKTASGGDYNPPITDIQYYLATGNPQVATWWRGLLRDLLDHYPEVDGIELREPIVNWWGAEADYNPAATRAFQAAHPGQPLGGDVWRRFRQQTLTRFLADEIALVHGRGRPVHVTTVADTDPTGRLIASVSTARETGFDLDGLLRGRARPDAVKVELIWQQWARLYGRIAFDPDWTRRAADAFRRDDVRGRTKIVVHVELTDFGESHLSVGEFYRTLRAADQRTVAGVDFYSAALADRKHAWPAVRAVYGGRAAAQPAPPLTRDRRVLVLYDAAGAAARRRLALTRIEEAQLLNLLGHFPVKWESRPVDGYRRGSLAEYDAVFYLGTVYGHAPQTFVSDVSVFEGTVVWIGQSLFELERSGVRLPFAQASQRTVAGDSVRYRGVALPAAGELIPTRVEDGAAVVASASTAAGRLPFIARARRFWYVAGSPFSFLTGPGAAVNGRYVVFADLLHTMLGVTHANARPRALVWIDGVTPLTSPTALRAQVAALAAVHVPFAVSVTPFYVDPRRHESLALSSRPKLTAALRNAVLRGGAIVMDGATHQYRGRTGADAEFWDLRNGGGLPEDSDAYVRSRVRRGLAELWRSGLHPLAWETPQYLATPFDYGVIGDFFSTFVEQRVAGVWRGAAYLQPLPYAVDADVYGARVVPESLGRVRDRRDVDAAAAAARRLLVVRDAAVGAYATAATRPSLLAGLAVRLRRLGFAPTDLYALRNVVRAPGRVEITGPGAASLPIRSGWYLQNRLLARSGDVVRASVVAFPSYARPVVSLRPSRRSALLSLRALSPHAGAALLGEPASELPPALPGLGPDLLTGAVRATLVAGVVGVALLCGTYVAIRIARRRTSQC